MKVKICGLTNLDDALCALDAGADYLGFILYPDSPRGITLENLADIRAGLANTVQVVAVMVNPSLEEAQAAIEQGHASMIQVHGDIGRDVLIGFSHPIWRGVAASAGGALPDPAGWAADCYVVDAAVPGMHGGTGTLADWKVASQLAKEYPVMLAGGLTPANVAEGIVHVMPLGVDVASGVESRPGRKDHAMVRAFVQNAKGVMP
jgi:phosphoribosylanthranilate isomerase